jgi:hypothetical protein
MTTRTITLSAEHWQRISDALLDCCDKGPPGEGWKSAELSSAVAALDTALAQPEPEFTAEEVEMIQAPWCYLAPAQPEPVGPTDDQAEDLADALNFMDGYAEHEDGFYVCASNLGPFARAVLTRWGRPAITPIPLSERLPGPEDCAPWPEEPDCDPWCWAAKDIDGGWEWTQLGIGHFSSDLGRVWRKRGYTHWLPFHALPLPTAVDGPGS